MKLDIHVNWQLSKQETCRQVSRYHIAGSDVVSEDVHEMTESRKIVPKENVQVNYDLVQSLNSTFCYGALHRGLNPGTRRESPG